MRVPITRPIIGEAEQTAVAAVLASGQLVQGPLVAEFERQTAESVGVSHAIAVTNCTAALHLALLALGIGPGDRVAVAPYSWVATANVIALIGAVPVFVDIDPATFNMSPERLAEVLDVDSPTRTIKAVMPVHTFGNPSGIAQLSEVAANYDVPIIEDAACALGATVAGRAAGSFGTVACFSYHPRKIITTGEGGMLVCNDDGVAAFARSFRNHGQRMGSEGVEFVMVGGNLRMTEMQGALGIAQMRRLEHFVAERRALATIYDQRLIALGMTPQSRSLGAAVQSYVALVPAGRTSEPVISELRAGGIEATIGTNAIPFTRYFQEQQRLTMNDLPAVHEVSKRAITLPLFPGMTDSDQDAVADALQRALR